MPSVALLPDAFDAESPRGLASALRRLLEEDDLDAVLERDPGTEKQLLEAARTLARRAYPQVLAGVNVMLWSCIPRRNAFRAQGTLGAVELLAPQRGTRVVHGALRVGIKKKAVVYYSAHAIIDIGHAEGWLDHVVTPQVDALAGSRFGIAEGLIARADASLDYFDYCLAVARRIAA